MSNELTKALSEALKEGVRNTIFIVLPTLLTFLVTGINLETGEIAINFVLLRAVALYELLGVSLTMLDRAKHIYEKLTTPNSEGKSMGLIKL